MFDVDDEPVETLHIYVIREAAPKPSLLPIVLSVVALSLLVAVCAISPYQQPVTRAVIRVPAVLLPLRTFTATVAIISTGVKVYPATTAHGWLTFSNGSIIGQSIPTGFTVAATNGVPVMTDAAVYVPAATANGFGKVTVSARLGRNSVNLPAYSVNFVIGSSLFVRNLSPFTGGRDSYSVKYVTTTDKQAALLRARGILLNKSSGLHYPCTETKVANSTPLNLVLAWHCQFLSYHIPAFYHVTAVRLSGKNLLLDVWFIPRPVHIWVK